MQSSREAIIKRPLHRHHHSPSHTKRQWWTTSFPMASDFNWNNRPFNSALSFRSILSNGGWWTVNGNVCLRSTMIFYKKLWSRCRLTDVVASVAATFSLLPMCLVSVYLQVPRYTWNFVWHTLLFNSIEPTSHQAGNIQPCVEFRSISRTPSVSLFLPSHRIERNAVSRILFCSDEDKKKREEKEKTVLLLAAIN